MHNHNKEQQLKKRLTVMAALAVVFAILTVVCSVIGFSGNAPTENAEPETESETVQTVPETTEPETVPQEEGLPEETAPESSIPETTVPGENSILPRETEVTQPSEPGYTPLAEALPPETEAQNTEDSASLLIGTPDTLPQETPESGNLVKTCFRIAACFFLIAFIADVFMMVLIIKNMRQFNRRITTKVNSYQATMETPAHLKPKAVEPPSYPIPGISLGKAHNVGRRDYQQDSFGQVPVLNKQGILAILADGMGGLSGGEKVSQRLVMECMNFGASMTTPDRALDSMLAGANQAINQQLGPDGLRKSGSTLVSVLIAQGQMHWISVGDSRIYLYRDRYLSQITRDHDLFQQWMPEILEGTRSLEESLQNMDGRKLTSFIGMGDIRYVDKSQTPIRLQPGDRILLMSDGIYGAVPDAKMEAILRSAENVQDAANQIAQCVVQLNSPYQDNYTLMILGYDPKM